MVAPLRTYDIHSLVSSTAACARCRPIRFLSALNATYPQGEQDWKAQDERLLRLLRRALELDEQAPLPHAHSFLISLAYPRLEDVVPFDVSAFRNVDAVELRADLLHSQECRVLPATLPSFRFLGVVAIQCTSCIM